ncbi:polysaccharide pyruvyl transferase family protein [Flavobacterium luminosum]|uniref:Polysaccharide pyruvyl transferase family protein n=1 Tax=Flavobacterium luminosum TaxID=2949086 RepID=A0ABT0TNK7_9FLAO|nr:polysaccharide pyruvyl transferase family protein [Flavobacterium sp. HXWNR70]MCL9809081.1 polysaccharide pyruvyl transferase family protein [Flavobacterium sp. HXWNR70]
MFKNTLRLFWWNEIIIQGKSKENYGDVLGKFLVEKISGKRVIFAWPKKFSFLDFFSPIYVTVGSILANVNSKCIVWGSGIINRQVKIKKAKFLAVRGPQTRKFLMDLGYDVPEIYGDPALLLPRYFHPEVEKKYRYGIVPHYNDYKVVEKWFENRSDIHLIDMMTNDIESKTVEFLQCEKIISSSLHGIIIAHAYGIPAVWQKFSDKVFGDDIKYQDYMESVHIPFYHPEIKAKAYTDDEMESLFEQYKTLPNSQVVEDLRNGLMEVCPFLKKIDCF